MVQKPRTCVAGSLRVPLGAGDMGRCLCPAQRTLRPVSSCGNGSLDALATAAISRRLLWPVQLSLRLCLFDSQRSTALRLAGRRQPESGGLASVSCLPPKDGPPALLQATRSPSRGPRRQWAPWATGACSGESEMPSLPPRLPRGPPGTCGQGRDLDRGLAPPRPHQLPAGACGVSARVLELWGLKRCLRAGASAVSGSWVAGQRGPGLWLSRFSAPAQFLSPPILSRDPPRNFQCAEPPGGRITKQGAGSGEPSCDLRPGRRPCHFQAVLNGRSAESPPAPSPGQDP